MSTQSKNAFVDRKIFGRAIKDSFVKLKPKTQAKNPVMLLVYISAILTTGLWIFSLFGIQDAPSGFTLAIAVIPVSYTHLDVYKRQGYALLFFIEEDEAYALGYFGIGDDCAGICRRDAAKRPAGLCSCFADRGKGASLCAVLRN